MRRPRKALEVRLAESAEDIAERALDAYAAGNVHETERLLKHAVHSGIPAVEVMLAIARATGGTINGRSHHRR
jgi:hypothetical protein